MSSQVRSTPFDPDVTADAAAPPSALRARLLVPAAAILAVALATVVALAVVAAVRENRIAFETTRHTVQSLLDRERTHWEQLALDVSWWQTAFDVLRGDLDAAWADDNIGPYHHENFGTTLSGAADPQGRVVYAAYAGERGGEDMLAAALDRLDAAAAAARATPVEEPETVSGFFQLDGDVYIFGLGALTPEYPTEADLTAPRGLVLVARRMDPAWLAGLGESFVIRDLRLADPDQASAAARIPLPDDAGGLAGMVTWSPPRPGDDLLLYLLPGLAVLGIAIAVLARRVMRVWRDTVDCVYAREQTLQAVFDGAGDGILVIGENGTLHSANRAAQAIFDEHGEALPGRNIRTLMASPGDPAGGEDWLSACLSGRCSGGRCSGEVTGLRPDGCLVPLFLTLNCVPAGGGRLCIGVLHDLSERLRIEDQLREEKERAEAGSRAKSAFLANVSHELRTPLNAMIGFAELIRDGMFGPVGNRRYQEYAADIHESGQHLLQLINGILDLTAIEHGSIRLAEETFPPVEVADEALRLIAPAAGRGDIRIERQVAANLPLVIADRLKVRQILLNLLSNAVKFTNPGGRVTMRIGEHADGGLVVTVGDTGIGMSTAMLDRAFQAFAQAEHPYQRRRTGAGLGLTLSRQLAEVHGGTLGLESASGEGTTATLWLPPGRLLSECAARALATVDVA